MADTNCFKTKVRNMTGKSAVFGFLPPHGKRLAAGEEYTFFGSPSSLAAAITRKRHRQAFEDALQNGDLVVVYTPAAHVYDADLDVTKTLGVTNGSVVANEPCWGEYSSSQGA